MFPTSLDSESRFSGLASIRRSGGVLTGLLALAGLAGCVVHTGTAVPYEPVTYGPVAAEEPVILVEEPVADFGPTLEPHGRWLHTATCGRAWRPHAHVVGAGFMPYRTGGQWVYTDQGWSFDTDWDWGWAVFHYGRWCPDPGRGWLWVPGTEWAPAWVEWRTGGGYIGWAPLLPATMIIVEAHWIFVESRHFHQRHTVEHTLPPHQAHHAYESTRPVHEAVPGNPAHRPTGPRPADVARDTRREVKPVHIVAPEPGIIRKTTAHTIRKRPTPAVVKPVPRVRPATPAKPPSPPGRPGPGPR